jgi:hypothetical protein
MNFQQTNQVILEGFFETSHYNTLRMPKPDKQRAQVYDFSQRIIFIFGVKLSCGKYMYCYQLLYCNRALDAGGLVADGKCKP